MSEMVVSEMIMSRALRKYCKTISILKKGYVAEKYRIEQLCRSFLGELPVKKVGSVEIATYRDQRLQELNGKTLKTISPATVRLEMSLLSNFFDIARIEWGIATENPVANVRKPKAPPGRDRRLTAREDRLIYRYSFNHANPEFYTLIVLALETAMRQGEMLGLRWEHINLKTRIVHLPETKNGTKRDVPLSIAARDSLIRLGVKPKGKVFSYTASGLKSTWRFMREKLGIEDLHFHDLRHEAITRLFELGTLDIMEIAAISGHKSLSMLKRYTHLQAAKLIHKLEGTKNKGKMAIISNLVPYPARVECVGANINLRLLDFDDLIITAPSRDDALKGAQDALLRRIVSLMKTSDRIPQPDQYLEDVDELEVIMVDPLAA